MHAPDKVDFTEFRRALGAFTTGVTVVTTYSETHKEIGLTANSFNSVSLDPPMVLWSLAKAARSLDAFKACNYFAIHILSDSQEAISTRFAQRGTDKFSGLELERGPEQIPLLTNCSARFICKTRHQYEGGDHIIFVGDVVDFSHWQRLPLLFHAGKYGQMQQRESISSGDNDVPDDSLGYLLRLSYRHLIEPLMRQLAQRELTISQHYFLANLARSGSGNRAEMLASLAANGTAPAEREVHELVARGFIEEEAGIVRFTPAGLDLRVELAAIYKAIESGVLQNLGYSSAQILKVHLGQLISALSFDNRSSTNNRSDENASSSREHLL